jgi:hypothetical protein
MRGPAKRLSVTPEPAAKAPDPIDEQIASLLESVSSKQKGQAAGKADGRPDRVAAKGGQSGTARPAPRRRRRRARKTPSLTVSRPHLPTATVRQALAGIAIDLPRPYLAHTLRQAFSLIAIVLFSIAVGFLIVYLMSA